MKSNIGLWIDHKKAVIVTLTGKAEITRRMLSHMEKHVRFSGGAMLISAEDQRDRRFAGHLAKYYDRVIARIRGAGAILLLGPGEAKRELKSRLVDHSLGALVSALVTVDKMSDRQVAARVRKHFLS